MINPLQFDCPPPIYEDHKYGGWSCIGKLLIKRLYFIAKAIVSNHASLTKFIKHAKRLKRKEKGKFQFLLFIIFLFRMEFHALYIPK